MGRNRGTAVSPSVTAVLNAAVRKKRVFYAKGAATMARRARSRRALANGKEVDTIINDIVRGMDPAEAVAKACKGGRKRKASKATASRLKRAADAVLAAIKDRLQLIPRATQVSAHWEAGNTTAITDVVCESRRSGRVVLVEIKTTLRNTASHERTYMVPPPYCERTFTAYGVTLPASDHNKHQMQLMVQRLAYRTHAQLDYIPNGVVAVVCEGALTAKVYTNLEWEKVVGFTAEDVENNLRAKRWD